MGQNAQTGQPPRGFLTIDWMVLAVACIALLFLLGTMFRTPIETNTTVGVGGLRSLGPNDILLAFQDFSFDATGWTPAATSDQLPGLGPVLGPFTDEAVERSFAMPSDALIGHLAFDLHLIGDWIGQGEFQIALGEQEIMSVRLPGPESTSAEMIDIHATDVPGLLIFAGRSVVSPRPPAAILPGPADDFTTFHIRLQVTDPGETLVLRLMSEAEGGARWSLDNLTVVATVGEGEGEGAAQR